MQGMGTIAQQWGWRNTVEEFEEWRDSLKGVNDIYVVVNKEVIATKEKAEHLLESDHDSPPVLKEQMQKLT